MPMEKTLTALIEAETEARRIVDEAEKGARQIREATKLETEKLIEEARKREEEESRRVLEEARNKVRLEGKEILDRAEKEVQHWEELFQKKMLNY